MNGKRDMRKKFVKSSRPTYKKRIKKAQQGMRFANYNVVENPTIDYKDITNPTNPFSEYNFNTTYNTPQGLVVPTREDSKPDAVEETPVVANNPTVEPVVNKPVTKTAKSTWKSPYTNRKQWTTELINAYKKAGITNDNAIRMLLAQDALESSWGKSAQGKYNFGNLTTGSSWKGDYVTGNDKNAKGEAIKQKFRSYNSMDEYAADKIQFLKRLYDFDENDDINKFVAKLTGSNKGKRRYAEASNYAKVLTGIYNGIPKGEGGLVVDRRDAIKDYRPNIPDRIRRATPAERIQSMINIYGQSEQPVVTYDTKSPWQHQQAQVAASKGYDDYMQAKKYEEGLHNLNGFITFTDYTTLATGLGSLLSKGASVAGKQVAKQAAKRVVGKEFKRQSKQLATPNNMLPNNVGWGPRQTIKGVIHDKDTMEPLRLYSPKRYDAINEGAPKAGVWFQGKLGTPRDATNTSIANKVEKATNARDLFAKRPVRVEGDLELNKPLVTVGDVPNRAQIQKAADTMGGDGVIFNNVYDNGYGHNQVIFSYRTDLKNGRMYNKSNPPEASFSKAIDEAVSKGNPKVKDVTNEIGRIRATNVPDGTYEFKDNNFRLPSYATPNSPDDPINLHAARLANGGFDRLPEVVNGQKYFNTGNYNWAYKSKSMYPKLHYYDREPLETIGKVSDDFTNASITKAPTGESYVKSKGLLDKHMIFATSGTGNIYVGRKGLSKVAGEFGDNNIRRTVSHEMDHAIHIPGEAPKGFDTSLTDLSDYFSAKNGTELTGRGTQIKDYYGLSSPDQEITEDMLRYAAKNYIKDTGMNNNMTEFFKSIVDWKEAAKWLSKWSTMIATPVTISKMSKHDNSRTLERRD